jgi:hypothetical protein
MHHDIYDTPLVDVKNEKNFFQRLIKYDYLFLSNRKNMVMFQNFFNKHNSDFNNKIPKLMETGYLKLDYLKKKIKLDRKIDNCIVIAPTIHLHIEKLTIYDDLENLIKNILSNTKFEIFFRPHPGNRNTLKILNIVNSFKNNSNFRIDKNEDYFEVYSKSLCLITDISGTAYTYAFLTNKPVIFFSKNEKLINELGYSKLSYFEDRNKIGAIIKNSSEIIEIINNIKSLEKKIKISNSSLLKEINYLGNSKNRIREIINEILVERNNREKI